MLLVRKNNQTKNLSMGRVATKYIVIIMMLIFSININASKVLLPDSVKQKNKRLAYIFGAEALMWGGSLYYLNKAWYSNYPRSSFHLFNDNDEWLNMDKVGHFSASFYAGRAIINYYELAGMERRKAIWYGGVMGSVYLLNIELLDGFSKEWGFSVGDFTVNTLGSAFIISQRLLWNEDRIMMKVSYTKSKYVKYRTEIFGANIAENMLKDYNGQTYWMSANISSFLSKDTKFPKWLNIALGYGADAMVSGTTNTVTDTKGNSLPYFDRQRQFYLSLDIDITKFKTKSKLGKFFLNTFGFLKIPSPTLEINLKGKPHFYPLYF